MLQLMKYEFRKTMFSKIILLVITAVAEVAYLLGIFLKWDKVMVVGVLGLTLCGIIGIFYIGIESLLIFQKDLNTKQSYMLFLTPRNSYQILGAKVLENGISIFLTGAFYAALAAIDFTVGVLYIGGMKEFLDFLSMAADYISLEINVTPQQLLMVLGSGLASWLMMIVIGNLAITLSATVFAGKKFSGIVSFILYMVLSWAAGSVLEWMTTFSESMSLQTVFAVVIAGAFIISALMYVVTGWIMEKKLSV